jgi:hypothetical protein
MANNYMMSPDNPFGLRPDEVAGAVAGGYVNSAPTKSEMNTAVNYYNSISSAGSQITTSERNSYISLANDNGSNQVAQAPAMQQVPQVPQVPLQQIINQVPLVPQVISNTPIDNLLNGTSGITFDKAISAVVSILFISTILKLFK